MGRKDKSIIKRILNSLGSLALIGAGGYMFFAGFSMLSSIIFTAALLSICTPVITDGGSIAEVVTGVVEVFIEGVMGVFEAIASVFNF